MESSNSFPKENRLSKRKDFYRVYNEGKIFQNEHFKIFFLKKDLPPPRLGLSLSKRVGKAVVRNRIKRALRESFRMNKELFGNLDVVVQPRRRVAELDNKKISEKFLDNIKNIQ